jgi:hypothetical protein
MRPCMFLGTLLLAAAALLGAGCGEDGMGPDTTAPTGSQITNPEDGSALNAPVINVRGRAEVGATIDVYVNDEYQSSGVASPAVPSNATYGRFTVEDVALGEEGEKTIRAVVTDLYGNVAADPIEVHITLDRTAPPLAAESVIGAVWSDTLGGVWQTSMPQVDFVGRTDATASGQRVRYGSNEFAPDSTYTFPGAPGEPDSVRFYIPITVPPLDPEHPEALVRYYAEAFDPADNVASVPIDIFWVAAGKETVISYDDGDYGSYQNWITGGLGQMLAVKFQAPTWANYILGVQFHTMNDNQTNPQNPTWPTTQPFLIWIWRLTGDLPGTAANEGLSTGEPFSYPEDEWVEFRLTTAVNISSATQYPEKQFFAGMEWQTDQNPRFAYDPSTPIDYRSYIWDYEAWQLQSAYDVMVRVIVSDLPSIGGRARVAVVEPVFEGVPTGR